MSYKTLKHAVNDLENQNMLIRVSQEVDPNLELAEIQRQLYSQNGKAVLFENVKGCKFPVLANLYGDKKRCRYIFRDSFHGVQSLIQAKGEDPLKLLKQPLKCLSLLKTLSKALPKKIAKPKSLQEITLQDIPQIKSWPKDGGAFITLPQVLSVNPEKKSWMHTNMGMYRVQISGNEYLANQEIGLHYQIHRGIGVHHHRALQKKEPLKVAIFVGGPPAHAFGAVMPLPEGLPEMAFAGALANRRFRYFEEDGWVLSAEADFIILGTIEAETKPEGPFGDHLGYYSLTHEMPMMKVHKVYAQKDAVYPFTVVGRPPQEDTSFGNLIHELTGNAVSVELPGVKSLNAVDESGVHPLLLSIGSERYVPYKARYPMEILTQSNAILGFGQCSLAKYLCIVATEDNPDLNINDITAYWTHLLERIDWKKDLHFQTNTTMDTLDYSGTGLNKGSKVVLAAAGEKRVSLLSDLSHVPLETSFKTKNVIPGVFAVQAPPFSSVEDTEKWVAELPDATQWAAGIKILILCNDSEFVAKSIANWVWVTFTRSNPSHDIYGIDAFQKNKHWGCNGPLIIDARFKPHHAPPLLEDASVTSAANKFWAANIKGRI
jgi:4-hydroxy-3-polyprenylbenzoate decarboxylase